MGQEPLVPLIVCASGIHSQASASGFYITHIRVSQFNFPEAGTQILMLAIVSVFSGQSHRLIGKCHSDPERSGGEESLLPLPVLYVYHLSTIR